MFPLRKSISSTKEIACKRMKTNEQGDRETAKERERKITLLNRRGRALEGLSNATYSRCFGLEKGLASGGATYAEGVVLVPRVV